VRAGSSADEPGRSSTASWAGSGERDRTVYERLCLVLAAWLSRGPLS
jgi:hypothetical protein